MQVYNVVQRAKVDDEEEFKNTKAREVRVRNISPNKFFKTSDFKMQNKEKQDSKPPKIKESIIVQSIKA